MRELLDKVVEYIEYTDSALDDLRGTPHFSETTLNKTAADMCAAGLISEAEQPQLIDLFRSNPDKALESIAKLASQLRREPEDYSLGQPSDRTDTLSRLSRDSDRILYEKLGLV